MRIRTSLLLGLAACSDYGVQGLSGNDTFIQPGEEVSADILFVVDDSASMAEEQATLAGNFETFTTVLAESYADFRLGITTTDPDLDGLLLGPVITPDTPDLAAAFQEQIDSMARGSRDEQGLHTARLGVSPEVNPDFRRKDVSLDVVVFSDEDDHSPDPVDLYLGQLRTNGGEAGFVFHAIVGDLPEGCTSGGSAADPGERYVEAALDTGGFIDSICSGDFADVLTRIGLDVAGLQDTFLLTSIPKDDSLQVWVDGVSMPEREEDGWTYSLGDNAVVFTGRAVPRPGMKVTVRYDVVAGTPIEQED